MTYRIRRALKPGCGLFLALLIGAISCSHVATPPPNISPTATVAFRLDQVASATDALKAVVCGDLHTCVGGLHGAGTINAKDTLVIISVHEYIAKASQELILSLQAGDLGATKKQQFVLAISKALSDLPAQLDPTTRAKIAPYIQAILTALAIFGSV